jgi:hypothetical protein
LGLRHRNLVDIPLTHSSSDGVDVYVNALNDVGTLRCDVLRFQRLVLCRIEDSSEED